jgi:hypothetical protein
MSASLVSEYLGRALPVRANNREFFRVLQTTEFFRTGGAPPKDPPPPQNCSVTGARSKAVKARKRVTKVGTFTNVSHTDKP